ncbi:interferon-induced, double-stranded RNA-activated protein kinase-like [Cheilinus undulatus]|uniref:interferon-induced, double-stranded RNA-activated protein kinase-like n=1 Tax=Cheilinus undulatus TaxID=241271 RepID=UPI001BD3EB03|nr:interferon-induced, double-stranded RNA-activated protein kinase-like [Cheilinus undulatus]
MDAGNFVARLNEYAQKNRIQLSYDFLGSDGPDHNKTFSMRAVVDGEPCPQGEGKTKKDAKQDAAKNALACLMEKKNQNTNNSTVNTANTSTAAALQSPRNLNYICWLNEYGQKNRLSVRAVESTGVGANFATQCCYFVVGDKEYPAASGATKREAKEKAAKIVHDEISGIRNTEMLTTSTVPTGGASPKLSARSAPRESSPQSTTTSSSEWVVFTDSNSSRAQMSSRLSEYGASSRECSSSSPSMQQYNYSSGVFTNSPSTSMDEINHLIEMWRLDTPQKQKDGSQKARLQALKPLPSQHQRTETTQNGTSTTSKFTTDFDSIKNISSGAFGCVFRVRDKLEDKYFAVKIVCSGGKSLREVRTLSDLQHQNIVRYYTCWEEDEGYHWDTLGRSSHSPQFINTSPPKFLYIKMELCDTKTLENWIQEKNDQSLPDCKRREKSLSIALQLFSGVEYIHSMNHIHRDLKPANILFGVDRRGRKLKIGDFGLVTRDDPLMDRTVGQGTPSYMAPEQKTGRNYDRKVDIFSLGLIYLELLWKLSTGMERAKVFEDARQQKFPSEFPQRFFEEKEIIKSMLCERPEGRPEASAVKAQLETMAQAIKAQRTV